MRAFIPDTGIIGARVTVVAGHGIETASSDDLILTALARHTAICRTGIAVLAVELIDLAGFVGAGG
jgi:hypothetical protein